MNEEMREEFERKMSELGFGERENDFALDEETGDYVIQDLNAMSAGFVIGYQASREAMKPIRLPDETDTTQCKSIEKEILYDGINYGIKQCKEAIESAGYKVAP